MSSIGAVVGAMTGDEATTLREDAGCWYQPGCGCAGLGDRRGRRTAPRWLVVNPVEVLYAPDLQRAVYDADPAYGLPRRPRRTPSVLPVQRMRSRAHAHMQERTDEVLDHEYFSDRRLKRNGRAICVALAAPGRTILINYLRNDKAAEETAAMV